MELERAWGARARLAAADDLTGGDGNESLAASYVRSGDDAVAPAAAARVQALAWRARAVDHADGASVWVRVIDAHLDMDDLPRQQSRPAMSAG